MEALDSLVRAAQQGDEGGFNCIVERFQDMAWASAYAMVGDRQLAEDAAQEAFLEAYLTLPKLREPAAFASWFRSIIFKQADRLTRGKRLASSPLEAAADLPGAEQDLADLAEMHEVSGQVREAIAALSERERLVVSLFYGTGYTLKEIAAFLDVPVTTVKKRLYDARQHLKDEFIDPLRDVLQAQRPSIVDALPARVRLLIAARLGDLDAVKMLLTHEPILLNMKMEREELQRQRVLFVPVGVTALHEAARHGHVQVTRLLLDYGANVNARTGDGMTPLHEAVRFHCHTIASLLLKHGADAELPLDNGLTALHLAALHGDVEMVQLLHEHGASIDSQSRHGRTPLHWAALKGHCEIVRFFCAHGADPRARDSAGRTPCDWAIARGYTAVAAVLQERIASFMKTSTLPASDAILGRVLNANGEPIDHKGSLENVTRLPLSTLEDLAKTTGTSPRLLETGIKAIDLMAPLAYGSVVGFIAGFGLGKEVVVEELMQHLFTKRQGIAVIAGMRETTYDASSLREMVREIEAEDRIAMLFEQTTDDASVRQCLLHAAATISANFKDEGRDVLLLIDSQVVTTGQMAGLRRFANARGITTLLFVPVDDLHQPTERAYLDELDVQLWFSLARARQGLWPAIDPLASRSRLLESGAVSQGHQRVAQRARELLQRYYSLRESASSTSSGEEDRQTLARGERLDLFFSQPFVVAEAFTDVPGASLTREETITSFRDLLDGRYDDVPVSDLKFIGQLERR